MRQETKATILFVDDDATNRQLFAWYLRDAGYFVMEAGTGQDALLMVSHKPDLIVLDVNLPDMTGFEVCRQLKARPETQYTSVIKISAVYSAVADRSRGLEEGADAYLVKPVEPRELLATIQAVLRIRVAETAAREAARTWRATFDAISDVVCLLAPDGRILRCNRALCQLVGKPFSELLRQPFEEVLRQGLGLAHLPQLTNSEEESTAEGLEVQLGTRWFRITSDRMRDEHGIETGSVHILADVTRRRELEEQLRQSNRLESIGRLAGGVAHDFNNLLTAILGNASLLIRTLPVGESDHERALTIERAAWRAAELTRQLLGFSRQTLLWLRTVDPGEVFDGVVEAVKATIPATIQLILTRSPQLWPIHADANQLKHALVNLCLNAIDAMPSGGRLVLEVSDVSLTQDHAFRHVDAHPGEVVRFRVADTGAGIAAELLDKIFDPFFTTKPFGRGSGMGLAMVHGIIKQHQGWIECESIPEAGTRFDLYLPRLRESPSGSGSNSRSGFRGARSADNRAVLLADDNETLRSLGAAYLRQGGFEVLLAANGREAVEIFARDPGRIAVVVLDRTMPFMSGDEALREMHRINPSVRALIASGSPWTTQVEGVRGVIQKPYRERELIQAVERALLESETSA